MKVLIIIGSTRPGRVSDRLAKWVKSQADGQKDGIDYEIVDLVDYPLPWLDEPISPQYNPERKPNEHAQKWLAKLAEADGFVLITPEYNRSTSGVLKNALDYVDFQMQNRPVALVAHGSTGGAQAVANLRMVIPGLKAVTVPSATFVIGQVGQSFDEHGKPDESITANPYGPAALLSSTLKELAWYTKALATARAQEK